MDFKYDIMKHPNVRLTTDGGKPPYIHGEPTQAVATLSLIHIFAFEEELKEKSERLNALNIELNLDKKDPAVLDAEPEQAEEQPERKCANRER